MKKFIIEIFKFTLFAIIFYIITLLIWESIKYPFLKPNLYCNKGSYGNTFTRLKEAKKINTVDVLILGSSHAYRGFDTRIFNKNNISSFNLGTSSQTPIQTLALLKRYLKTIHPKLIIVEVYPGVLNSDGVESSLDIINNDENDFLSLEMVLKQNNIKTFNTLIFNYYRNFLNLDNSFVEKRIKNDDTYISGGYIEKKIGYYKPKNIAKQPIIIDKKQLDAFEDIIYEIKNRNIELVLVYAPISKNLYSSYTNNHYFDGLMMKHSEYYNFNSMIKLNDTIDFDDSNHLNQIGVEKFNNKLIEIIKSRFSKN
jgi:hypothetical protein